MADDVQPSASGDRGDCESRLATCAEQLRHAARDTEDLLARSVAQLGECQRLTAIVTQHEEATQLLHTTTGIALHEVARLAGIIVERDREAAALEVRVAMHEAECRRLTRLVADRAREIFELRLALGSRGAAPPTGRDPA